MSKNRLLLSLVSLLAVQHSFAASDLYISEYIEGSSNNKALELANTTGADIDLTGYQIQMYFNGRTNAGLTINLSGTVENDNVFVLANGNAGTDILNVADQTNSAGWFNGDDAIVLLNNGTIIDSIGQIGTDPGSQWGTGEVSTQNNTLRRLEPLTEGDSNPNDSFDPSQSWEGFPQDTFADLGTFMGSDNGGTPIVAGQCHDPATLISAVQGVGAESPMVNQTVELEGIVVGDFQANGQVGGFYLQEETADQDGDAASSEGIFIFASTALGDVNIGDQVRVMGTVTEYFGLTELNNVTTLETCDTGLSLEPVAISFPLSDSTSLEAVEGMLITVPQAMTVTENYNLGRYHEAVLASERLYQPTHKLAPGADALAAQAENDLKRIILDDASTRQNPATVSYPAPALSASNTLRSGDTTYYLTGTMSYGFSAYRIYPTIEPVFSQTNPRTESPELYTAGNLKVASFNVLNYFNGDGEGGGFPTARGADTAAEFERQRAKIINALVAIDADIVGLIEIENDGYDSRSAIADLVNGLNNALPSSDDHYAFVNPGVAQIGDDAIAVGFIYKTQHVATVNSAAILDSSVDSRFIDSKNRPALAQTFRALNSEGILTVAVNHFKSKGSACDDVSDPNLNDGQGNCNLTRTQAAQALADWLATDPTGSEDGDRMIIGDLNAYAKEDPITALKDAGYRDLAEDYLGENAYSYVFSGQFGYLDYALANAELMSQVNEVKVWHINADEPRVLDYNEEFKSAEQVTDWYSAEAYRSSDHDPVIISLTLQSDLQGDFNRNGDLDAQDRKYLKLKILLESLYDSFKAPEYDLNGDGQTNEDDLALWQELFSEND